jgi:hypothetical protein
MRCKRILLGAAMCAAFAMPAFAQPGATDPSGTEMTTGQKTQPMPGSMNNATPGPLNPATPMPKPSHFSKINSSRESAKGVALTRISNPRQTLSSVTVQDSSGQTVGMVQAVETAPSGKPKAVDITLASGSGGKIVRIKASKLRYQSSSNLLQAKLTQPQIDALPTLNNP